MSWLQNTPTKWPQNNNSDNDSLTKAYEKAATAIEMAKSRKRSHSKPFVVSTRSAYPIIIKTQTEPSQTQTQSRTNGNLAPFKANRWSERVYEVG